MINPFKQISEMKKMRDQAMAIQRQLQMEEIVVEKRGVRVVMTGDQKIKSIQVNGKSDDDVKEAVNEAVDKSQKVAAKKLQEMGGGLMGMLGQ